jgi:hypothetical protein
VESKLVGPLVQHARLVTELGAHDATWYSSERYVGPGFLLAGDAGSFIDPLTSQGVYKALHSGVHAAAVINTVLRRPQDTALACSYFDDMERRAYESYSEIALTFYRASPYADEPFWRRRTRAELFVGPAFSGEHIQERRARRDTFEACVRAAGGQAVRIHGRPELRVDERPTVRSGFVVKEPALVSATNVDFSLMRDRAGVDVAILASLVDGRRLADIFEAYVAASGGGRSTEQARALLQALARLAEHDLIAWESGS